MFKMRYSRMQETSGVKLPEMFLNGGKLLYLLHILLFANDLRMRAETKGGQALEQFIISDAQTILDCRVL